jgi:hypothetical protein
MAAQLYFTADAPTSRFFQSWDLDLVFDVLQVGCDSCGCVDREHAFNCTTSSGMGKSKY